VGLWSIALALMMSLALAQSVLALGEITQKPGPAGCISKSGNGGACQKARAVRSVGEGVVISPDGKSLYTTSYHTSELAIFDRDPASGELRQKPGRAGCIGEGETPSCVKGRGIDDINAIVMSADGRFVYVAAKDDNAVAAFRRNPVTGVLHQLRGAAGCISETATKEGCRKAHMLQSPIGLALSPDGKNIYTADFFGSGVSILDRNPVTGALSQPRGASGCISRSGSHGCARGRALREAYSPTVSPDGKNVYVASESQAFTRAARDSGIAIFKRDPKSGELTQKVGRAGCINTDGLGGCQTNPLAGDATSVAISRNGLFAYVAAPGASAVLVFARHRGTGALTPLPGRAACYSSDGSGGHCQVDPVLNYAQVVTLSPDGANLYVSASGSNAISIFDRDSLTGTLTLKAGIAGCISSTGSSGACRKGRGLDEPTAPVVSPDGASFYVTSLGTTRRAAISIFDRN
jgi:DNA-binding beta-propeller fold protein YncE